jgi:hypothetical protein
MDWYRRLPDGEWFATGKYIRGEFEGVLFEIVDAGGGMSSITNRGRVTLDGREMPLGFSGIGQSFVFSLTQTGKDRVLSVTFMRRAEAGFSPKPLSVYLDAARRYGTLRDGDFVRLMPNARQVFVNGQLRRPQ